MAVKNGKELRIQLDEGVHRAILANANMRGISPAAYVTELFKSTQDFGGLVETMFNHVVTMKEFRSSITLIRDDVKVSRDFIHSLYLADAQERDQAEQAVALALSQAE